MAEQFRVGDIVECVDAKPRSGDPGATGLFPGLLYTVAEVDPPDCDGEAGVRVAEADPGLTIVIDCDAVDAFGLWYASWRFRLIHRPRAEFLTELLSAPVDAPKPTEDA